DHADRHRARCRRTAGRFDGAGHIRTQVDGQDLVDAVVHQGLVGIVECLWAGPRGGDLFAVVQGLGDLVGRQINTLGVGVVVDAYLQRHDDDAFTICVLSRQRGRRVGDDTHA